MGINVGAKLVDVAVQAENTVFGDPTKYIPRKTSLPSRNFERRLCF